MLVLKKISILLFSAVVAYEGWCFLNTSPFSHNSADSKEIREAILDYAEGVYTVDTLRIHKSVHPDLVKRGSWYDPQQKSYSPLEEMSFQQLIDLTHTWNRDGKRANAESIRKVEIFDIQDKTASAKLTAVWGTDYFHLVKMEDGKWYIMNVLWQSHPHKIEKR